ncbi:beta-lactamase family protein [Chromohalobacter canadensis]|uniref:serine hydrolase domain-containing protein n=1 Tax=Chromohalobacter canadensis TaxID=141389 RepID=UPI0021C03BA5|nr:serine hydrolase [Chromohalobacter canadensis]MCT8467577.1 beta-lactamase family protein [Chromohalobacter canadensis]MCT8470675.1 beta-lactamase family protein [Chromohalobacter canadensis]MCT8498074.1 beta-lactamase family protein [Chromohalobacter canadensis]
MLPLRRCPWRLSLLTITLAGMALPAMAAIDRPALEQAAQRIGDLPRTHTLLMAVDGDTLLERGWRGHDVDDTANIKSLSKIPISALVGAAIARDVIQGVDQPVTELLGGRVPRDVDPRVHDIKIGHLLSMQAGLERTSGANYGGWVASDDWVGNALSRPFVADPGGRMLYSTGNSHLLSAALTDASGRDTLTLMREWLGTPLGIEIPPWTRDPQGIYFGGNEMGLTPRALLKIGELYRQQGMYDGERVLPAEWIERSWQARTRSHFNQDDYGYGWFSTQLADTAVYYGWGYGGQLLFVVPAYDTTIVMTSDPTPPSNGSDYLDRVKAAATELIEALD